MTRRSILVAALVLVAAGIAAIPAATATERPLRIAFPEGWSARQMADRAAEVRRIAIEQDVLVVGVPGEQLLGQVARVDTDAAALVEGAKHETDPHRAGLERLSASPR